MVKNFFVSLVVSILLLSCSHVLAQEKQVFFTPPGKMFLTFNWDLSLKGNGFGSKASIVDGNTATEYLDGEAETSFYSYKNFFVKSGYIFTDSIGAYVNVGLTERAFMVDYHINTYPSIDQYYLFYQQYYHLEAGCRLISYDWYLDIGGYYGIQKGDMTVTIKNDDSLLWEEAKKGNIIIKENSRRKINNDFGITAALGVLFPLVEDMVFFDASLRLIHGIYPAFELDGETSGDFKWKLYNMGFGLVLGITAVF